MSFVFLYFYLKAQDSSAFICLNQEGFYPNAPKIAVVVGSVNKPFANNSSSFYMISETSGDTAFQGKLSATRRSLNSSNECRIADFGVFTRKGSYRLAVAGCCRS